MTFSPRSRRSVFFSLALIVALIAPAFASAQKLEPVDVEGQPLAANVGRILDALQFLGSPLAEETIKALRDAVKARDARKVQELLDPHVLLVCLLTRNRASRRHAVRPTQSCSRAATCRSSSK